MYVHYYCTERLIDGRLGRLSRSVRIVIDERESPPSGSLTQINTVV